MFDIRAIHSLAEAYNVMVVSLCGADAALRTYLHGTTMNTVNIWDYLSWPQYHTSRKMDFSPDDTPKNSTVNIIYTVKIDEFFHLRIFQDRVKYIFFSV